MQAKGEGGDGWIITDVLLADRTNLNQDLVKQSLASCFFRYSKDETIKQLEVEARDGKRGLWRDPILIPPWVFRKIQRKEALELSDFQYPGTAPSDVLANKQRRVYRDPSCKRYATMLEQKSLTAFTIAEEAEEEGYHKVSDCPRHAAKR